MPFKTPSFWSSGHDGDWRALALAPLGSIYHRVVQARLAKPALPPPVPVICIGNATVGGVGKTPIVARLAQVLTERGHAPHILTRGYGGRAKGPLRVTHQHLPAEVGDEALMLASHAPVWVAKDRAAGAEAAAAAGAGMILMDDGLQNPSLAKTLSVLVVDDRSGFGNGKVFPAGPLRERPEAALARCGAVIAVLPQEGEPSSWTKAFAGGKPVYAAHFALALDDMPEGPLLAFCGIGQPERFERSLSRAGAEIAAFRPFPDHHSFLPAELRALKDEAARLSASLVTTEKDFARLAVEDRADITPLRGRMIIEGEDALVAMIEEVL
ncbi:MAG: tetraacyldisaccharide 4'-kinase [Parvularcula sp.]|jgi:tetraacyldisaccharide 4'-kinase|nr:tetraacyldisaccharide 4'-kinase [Parvularcula sp.]